MKSERLLNALSDVRYISNVLPESKVNLLEQDKRYNISPFHRLVFVCLMIFFQIICILYIYVF